MRFCLTLGVCVALLAAPPVLADSTPLTTQQVRDAARAALSTGRPQDAVTFARALLARDNTDVSALLTLARALRELNEFGPALDAAKSAWRAAETPLQRYASATVVAQIHTSKGARTRAQVWLRRAAHVAPEPRLRQAAIRDFRFVRDRNPWTTNLSFGATPSSNINNGSQSETIVIDGLSYVLNGDARALSGTEFRASIDTEFNQQLSDRSWVFAALALDSTRYRFSSAAREQVVTLSEQDLNFDQAELSLGMTTFPKLFDAPFTATIGVGRAWYGGDPLVEFTKFSMEQTLPLSARSKVEVLLDADHQRRISDPINSSTSYSITAALAVKLNNHDNIQLSLTASDTQSEGDAVAHDAWRAGLSYQIAKPVMGARLGLSLGYEERFYGEPYLSVIPRADERLNASAKAFFPELDIYGFAPELVFSIEDTKSNISLYDARNYGVTFGFRSTF